MGSGRERCYLGPPAPTIEVMQEQIEYLLMHASPACVPECPECFRLEQVKHYLLTPFTGG